MGERSLARVTRVLLAPYMLYAMAKLMELLGVTRHKQKQGEIQEKETTGERIARGCS